MSKVFVIADTHFGHDNIINVPVRREMGFKDVYEHDEHIIDNWRRVVGKRDKVFLLGDIGWDNQGYVTGAIAPRLPGTIHVVGGNHDTGEICALFHQVHGVAVWKQSVLTHIPIHPQEMWWDINVHGHLHGNVVKKHAHSPAMGALGVAGETDPRYICVSCEHIGYTPVELGPLLEDHRGRWGKAIEKLSPLPAGRRRRR